MNFIIDYKGLTAYLKTKKYKDFHKGGSVLKATAMDDIEFFKMDKSKITMDCFINYKRPFLVDSVGNDLTVAMLTKRKYKNPDGRLVRFKHLHTVISDCSELYGSCINGYWIIPDKFILPVQ